MKLRGLSKFLIWLLLIPCLIILLPWLITIFPFACFLGRRLKKAREKPLSLGAVREIPERAKEVNHRIQGWIWCLACLIFIITSWLALLNEAFQIYYRWLLGSAILCFFFAYSHLGEGPLIKELREKNDQRKGKERK